LPSDASLWSWFLHHPVIAPHLPETQYPTLYGKFPSGSERPSLEQIMRRGADLPTSHCLLLDRRDRRAYVAERDQAMILFALMEPEEGDAHNVFVDGMLISSGVRTTKSRLPMAPGADPPVPGWPSCGFPRHLSQFTWVNGSGSGLVSKTLLRSG